MARLAELVGDYDHDLSMTVAEPYAVVTQRFGRKGVLVDLADGSTLDLERHDYHADVSSFAAGFVRHAGRTLLVTQTAWNRLDILDPTTGDLLTPREVSTRRVAEAHHDADGQWVPPCYEETNYADYFHSQLHVSPAGTAFLSNGWHWGPADRVVGFTTAGFLTGWELSGSWAGTTGSGYNWDRPCTFIDDHRFVVATDETDDDPEDLALGYVPGPSLRFFDLDTPPRHERVWVTPNGEEKPFTTKIGYIGPVRDLPCDILTLVGTTDEREVEGELWYDRQAGHLLPVTATGTYAVDLDGQVVAHCDDITADTSAPPGHPPRHNVALGWHFAPEHSVFYRVDPDSGEVVELPPPR